MDLDEYQTFTGTTAIYPGVGVRVRSGEHLGPRSPEEKLLALTYLSLGLGEAGEIQGKVKKVIRDDGGILSPDRRDAIVDELGDLLWYVSRLADEMGVALSEVAARNVAKLTSRRERGMLAGSGDDR